MSDSNAYWIIKALVQALEIYGPTSLPEVAGPLAEGQDYLGNYDPTPYCQHCGGGNPANVCKCGPLAENE